MDLDKYVDVEAVIENATYTDAVDLDVAKLMMEADIVTIRGTSVFVQKVEVTDRGLIRFHGEHAKF